MNKLQQIMKIFVKPKPLIYITPYVEKIWDNVNSREDDFRNISKDLKSEVYNNTAFFKNYFEAYEYLKDIYTIQTKSNVLEIDRKTIQKYPLKAIIEETGYEHSVSNNDRACENNGVSPNDRIKDFSKFESKWLEENKTLCPFDNMGFSEFHNKLEQEIFKQSPSFLKKINFHYISEYDTSMLDFFQNHNVNRISISQGNKIQTNNTKWLIQTLENYLEK